MLEPGLFLAYTDRSFVLLPDMCVHIFYVCVPVWCVCVCVCLAGEGWWWWWIVELKGTSLSGETEILGYGTLVDVRLCMYARFIR